MRNYLSVFLAYLLIVSDNAPHARGNRQGADMQADELRECLKELGWKQSDLARRLEITEATVSRWANGEPIPAYIAQYLGLVRDVGRLHHQYVIPPEKPRAETRAEAMARNLSEPGTGEG